MASISNYPLTIASTLGCLGIYIGASFNVGRLRQKYGIKAPATTGHIEFENGFRVHYNTLENLAIIIPSMWMASLTRSDKYGAICGGVWTLGRILYWNGYPEKREAGTALTFLANLAAMGIAGYFGVFKPLLMK